MPAKVTIQDIADALGLSRNTVSKALNNTGVLSDATRERVLKTATEMGYKQFSYISALNQELSIASRKSAGNIAILSGDFLGSSHFASTMLDKFQREVSLLGYTLSMHRILPEELMRCRLPATLDPDRVSGVVCYEIFDLAYAQMLCETGLPLLFVDSPVTGLDSPIRADMLYMENNVSIQNLVRELVLRGKTRFGFIGEKMHCQSFHERYVAFATAIQLLGMERHEEFIISDIPQNKSILSRADYNAYVKERLLSMKSLPEVFLCANDTIAADTMQTLRSLGYSVPEDVYLCGFDDAPEATIAVPSLTTVHIHSQTMGYTAAQILISRIREPELHYRTVYTETNPVFRESTEG